MMPVRRYLLVVPLLVGCGKGNFNDRKPSAEAVMTYPLESKVTTLDPGKVQDVGMADVLGNVFEGLVMYDGANDIAPRLAERWETKDEGRTFVFHLRTAKFQDGSPFTADDVRRSWERSLGKTLASSVAADYLGAIVGVAEFASGKATSVSGLKVIDDHTLSVTLDKPRPYFLGNLTYPCAYVVGKAVKPDEIKMSAEAVGTGPFRFGRVEGDTQVELKAFEGYWGGKPKLARVVRPVVTDPATRVNGYRNGDYDLINLSIGDLSTVRADPKLKSQLRLEPRPSIYYFLLNQKAYAPFRDVRVRRAFALALDREKLVNELLPGETVANGLVAPGVPGYQKDYKGLEPDMKAARDLLAQAGYPGGKGLPSIELAYRAGRPDARLACEAAATAWRKELNAPVAPKALEWGAMLARRNQDRLQMGYMSWVADYLDPQNFLSLLMTTKSKLNHDGFSSAEFDRLCAQADVDSDRQRRLGLYQKAERIAVESAARLPLFFENAPLLVSPRLKSVRTNLFGLMPQTATEIAG